MTRYTTKHFWRMEESEEGEWVRYDEFRDETERLRMERDSYHERYKDTLNEYCTDMTKNYYKKQNLTDHYRFRVGVLFTVLMGTYGIVVGKLIGWSLGL